ncbi:M48 family metalloprotease [Prosthecodimorpha staleyi]|uniref:M48 family metalloprotease n=1 Tax=Prosthecodimorpha staleyi TaxID=2840188 RepID=A0A947GDY6_9HYPH|nr:M48 family metalloprotease [Prosthecodimorpha staleyi]MBT9293103.1 M48 family metalloprotease [Prosthecodimorpha staleyi]
MLVLSAWLGVFVGGIFIGLTAGPFIALGWMFHGLWAVPLFGLFFGALGARGARSAILRSTGTKLLPPDHPVSRMVVQLARQVNLPPPAVGIYPDRDLNAFAAGYDPSGAVVAFTQGLIDQATPRELIAIAAHEVAHIANRDIRRLQFAMSFQNALTWYLAFSMHLQGFMRWMLSTLGEMLVLRLSRQREYWADATAAALIGKEPMIDALRRLGDDPVEPRSNRLAYSRLMIRSNPAEVFSTHPTIANRIRALQDETFLRRLPYMRAAGQPRAPHPVPAARRTIGT